MEIIGHEFDELNLCLAGKALDITAKGRFWAGAGHITRIEIGHAMTWSKDGWRPTNECTVLEADDLPKGDGLALWLLMTAAIREQYGHEIQETLPLDQSAYVPIRINAAVG